MSQNTFAELLRVRPDTLNGVTETERLEAIDFQNAKEDANKVAMHKANLYTIPGIVRGSDTEASQLATLLKPFKCALGKRCLERNGHSCFACPANGVKFASGDEICAFTIPAVRAARKAVLEKHDDAWYKRSHYETEAAFLAGLEAKHNIKARTAALPTEKSAADAAEAEEATAVTAAESAEDELREEIGL